MISAAQRRWLYSASADLPAVKPATILAVATLLVGTHVVAVSARAAGSCAKNHSSAKAIVAVCNIEAFVTGVAESLGEGTARRQPRSLARIAAQRQA